MPVCGDWLSAFIFDPADTLNEGQTVEYEEVANRGKTSAENLKV
jgi:cold shock CspA family protein